MSAALDIPADQIVRMRTDVVKVLHQLALTATDPRERRRAATTVLRALSPSPRGAGGGPGTGWRTRENSAHTPTTPTGTLSTHPADPCTPNAPAPLTPTPPDAPQHEPPPHETSTHTPPALETPTPHTPARTAHPAAALLTRLATQLMAATSPAQRANILYDALHPETAMNTPRAKFIAHAPRSHLAPLLRARAVQPSDPRDSPNIHGKTTTFCILAAATNAHDTPSLYHATLAPPTPPHTTDWSITELKPIDSS